nr:arachidonate 5-lipoxygenase-activating protein isoform X1 [Pan troglodytes]
MDQETVGNVVLLAIVTLISVVQNGFFAHKVEHESRTQNGRSFQRTGTLAFERVYTANQNCVDAYPTFLAVLWSAGLLCSQVPAAFAGLMYLFVRQKYFVGYLGERTQRSQSWQGERLVGQFSSAHPPRDSDCGGSAVFIRSLPRSPQGHHQKRMRAWWHAWQTLKDRTGSGTHPFITGCATLAGHVVTTSHKED